MDNTNTQLKDIIDSPFSSNAEKQAAQKLLAEQTAPTLAPAPAAPAPTQAPKVKHYMDWIPDVSPAESAAYRKLAADCRADIDRRLKAAAEVTVKNVASVPQDASRKQLLLNVVNDPASSEAQILEAKISLATLEIEEFNQSRARRTTESIGE